MGIPCECPRITSRNREGLRHLPKKAPPRCTSASCRCACRNRSPPAEPAMQEPPGPWWSCWRSSSGCSSILLLQRGSPETPAAASQEKPSAEAQTASSGNIALDSKGYIMPVQRILVSPKVSGMIVKLDILEGRRVKKGDVLAELEDVDYRADLAHAESSLEAARQRLAEIEAMRPKEIGQAKAELERAKAELVQLKADFERQQRPVFQAEGHLAVGLRTGREQVSLGRSAGPLAGVRLGTAGEFAGQEGGRRRSGSATGRGRPGQGPMAVGQLQDPRPDRRHDPEEERRGRQPRQPHRHERLVQPLRPGRPLRPGGRADDRRARHQQGGRPARSARSAPRPIPIASTKASCRG